MRPAFLLIGISALAIACSSGQSKFDSEMTQGTATLADRAVVVSQDLVDTAVVQADRVIFPQNTWDKVKAWSAGDILVADSSDANPKNAEGFLRRIVSVEKQGSNVVVMTQPATLQEAVSDLDLNAQLETPALGMNGPIDAQNGIMPQGEGKPISVIDYPGTTIVDEMMSMQVDAQHTIGFEVFAKVNKGSVTFTPKWDIGASLGFLNIKSFHATATGEIDAELELDAGIKLQTNIDSATFTKLVAQKLLQSKSKTLADYDIKLAKLKVGPISIPITAHFKTTLDCDFQFGGGAEVVYGGSAKATVTAGVKYESGKLSPVFSKSLDLAQTGPNWTLDGLTKIKCSVKPTFDLKMFGVGSAQIWANGYADIGGSLTCNGNNMAQVDGAAGVGASAGVKAKIDILGLIKGSDSCTLFDVDKSASFQTTFPLPGGQNATCTGTDAYKRDTHTADPSTCFGGSAQQGMNGGGGSQMNAACTHDECTPGDKLGSSCSPCVQKICAQDSYCCDTFWGPSCMQQVQNICGYTCK